MFVTEYHWGVLVAQGSNGDLFYEKVNFTENLWSPVLYRKFLVSCPGETLTDVLLRQHICLRCNTKIMKLFSSTKPQILLTVVPANVCHRKSLGNSCSPGDKWTFVL